MRWPHALLFDFDGTLIDSASDIARSANAALVSLGRSPISEDRVQSYIGDGVTTLMRRCLGGDEQALQPALTAFHDHYRDHLFVDSRPYVGIPELLLELDDLPLGLVSNKSECYCRDILERLGWSALFSVVVGGDSLPERKPSPAPILHALHGLDLPAADGLLVGDGTVDVEAGRAAGVTTWAVSWGYKSADQLRAAGATEIIHSVAELRQRLSVGDLSR